MSAPLRSARIVNAPSRHTLAPSTESPSFSETGALSPVNMDISSRPSPERILPSAGTTSPRRTKTVSPGETSAAGTTVSLPPRTTRAASGRSRFSRAMASLVRTRASASAYLPSVTSARIMAEVSKYRCISCAMPEDSFHAPTTSSNRL